MNGSLLHCQGLYVPDTVGILVDHSIGGEEAHARDAGDRFGEPLVLVAECFVDHCLGLDVGVEVVGYEVVVSVLDDGTDEGGELVGVAECASADGLEDLG